MFVGQPACLTPVGMGCREPASDKARPAALLICRVEAAGPGFAE